MHRFRRSRLPLLVAALAVLVALPSLAGEVDATSKRWAARCDDVRLRTDPRVAAKVLGSIDEGARVVAVKTVRAGKWTARCGGAQESRRWLKIVSIDGRSTKARYGRNAVFAAKGLFKYVRTLEDKDPDPAPEPPPVTATSHVTNCAVRLRDEASVDAATAAILDENMIVTSSGSVTGGAWQADCGATVSGTSWLQVTAVGGQSVSSLYGVAVVYAASGLFTQVTTTSNYREGVDVSHWQGTINWAQVAAAGKSFAIAKATEGVGYVDDTYARNKAEARANGLKFGAYHFARPENDPVREADWFVDNAAYERGMLVPTLDLERTGGRGANGLTNWTKSWLQRVEERLGIKPMIYMSPSFWRTNLNDTRWFADNGYDVLWIAHWNVSTPLPPADNWAGKGWTFWQYTSEGRVPGIAGRVDLNRYRYESFARVTY